MVRSLHYGIIFYSKTFNSKLVPAPQLLTPPIAAAQQAPQAAHPIDSNTDSGLRNPQKAQEPGLEGPKTLAKIGAAAAAPPNQPSRTTTRTVKEVVTAAPPVEKTATITPTPMASVTATRARLPATASKHHLEKKRKRADDSEEEEDNEPKAVPSIPIPRGRTSNPEAKKKRTDYEETSGEEDQPLAVAGKAKGRAIQVGTSKQRVPSKPVDYVYVTEEEDEDEATTASGKRKTTDLETKRKPTKRDHPVEDSDSEHYESFHSDDTEVIELTGIDPEDLEGPCDYCERRKQQCTTENLARNRTCDFCRKQKRHCSLRDKRKEFLETKEGFRWLKANGHISAIPTKTKHTTTLTGKGKQKAAAVKVEKAKTGNAPKKARTAAVTSKPAADEKPTAGPSRSTRSAKALAEASPHRRPAAAAAAPRPKPRPTSKRGSKVQTVEDGTDSGSGEHFFNVSR